MKKTIMTVIVILLLTIPAAAFADCGCTSGNSYKGFPLADDTGYFAREFDKTAPAPGIDWTGGAEVWLGSAGEKGWVVKMSPQAATPGALILGFDQDSHVWVGIVREVTADTIRFETKDKGKIISHNADAGTIKSEFRLLGYIWPQRAGYTVQQVPAEQAVALWQKQEAVLIDVRKNDAYQQEHISGAVSIPLDELESRLAEIPHDRKVLLICHSGKGSDQANLILQKHGFTNTVSVDGGLLEWNKAAGKVRPSGKQ